MTAQPSTDKLDLNAEFVRGLLRDQHPDLADLPIRFVSGGGDNALYRLGDDLVMRLPLRPWASGLLRNEQKCRRRWPNDCRWPCPRRSGSGIPGAAFLFPGPYRRGSREQPQI